MPASRLLPQALLRLLLLSLLLSLSLPARTESQVIDDAGEPVRLAQPARRIISLAPNLTELLFAAGAGDRIVGTVRHSDWPAAAASIPQVGDSYNLDIETIVRLQPDLILFWESGNPAAALARLNALGLNVYRSEPDTLDKIASTLVRLGKLAGTENIADESASQMLDRIARLRETYARRQLVRVFYQFWDRPMFTVNDQHLIGHIIGLCGGRNIYAGLDTLTPQVSIESVLERDPQVIIASGEDAGPPVWIDDWKQWPDVAAVARGHLYTIPPDYIQRHTPRILRGATMMCEYIDRARQ